jgi:hypothetical protein
MEANGVVFFATDEHGFSRMNRSGVWWCFGATDGSEWGVFFATDEHGFSRINAAGGFE